MNYLQTKLWPLLRFAYDTILSRSWIESQRIDDEMKERRPWQWGGQMYFSYDVYGMVYRTVPRKKARLAITGGLVIIIRDIVIFVQNNVWYCSRQMLTRRYLVNIKDVLPPFHSSCPGEFFLRVLIRCLFSQFSVQSSILCTSWRGRRISFRSFCGF